MGDIIFSLPTIRAMGGGVLYLDPEGGRSSPLVQVAEKPHTKLNAASIESLKPVLLQQPYVLDVHQWRGETVDHDLDIFRQHHRYNNLSDAHLAPFGLPFAERDRQWLSIDQPIVIPNCPIVLSRGVRYTGNFNFWQSILPKILRQSVFVGYPKDFEIFVYTFGHNVQYCPTPDILTLARVIAGCQQFISNPGLPHALAEGMKKSLIHECDRSAMAAIFNRPDATYV